MMTDDDLDHECHYKDGRNIEGLTQSGRKPSSTAATNRAGLAPRSTGHCPVRLFKIRHWRPYDYIKIYFSRPL